MSSGPARAYLVLLVESQARSPAHSPDVCSCHLENIQLEGLLEKNDVVLGDPEAVVIARGEEGARGDGAEHLRVLQGALPLRPVWRKTSLRHQAGPGCPDHSTITCSRAPQTDLVTKNFGKGADEENR